MPRIGEAMSAGDKARGRHLIEQRLEQMIIVAVDQRDIDGGAGKRLGGRKPAEAGADDDHMLAGGGFPRRRAVFSMSYSPVLSRQVDALAGSRDAPLSLSQGG